MAEAVYRNHQHYIAEGWSLLEPKETFKALGAIIAACRGLPGQRVLDVGCATGELLGYLATQLTDAHLVGADVSPDLIESGRRLLPQAEFVLASALDLPQDFTAGFDIVCAMGCMSIFDETQIETFWDNLLRATKPDGLVVVLSPLNEFGVDAVIRHRKRRNGVPAGWETGWNVYSQETIREILEGRGERLELARFQIPFDIMPREDPIRTWTIQTGTRERQLTNGLKLLVDHYFMVVDRRGRA